MSVNLVSNGLKISISYHIYLSLSTTKITTGSFSTVFHGEGLLSYGLPRRFFSCVPFTSSIMYLSSFCKCVIINTCKSKRKGRKTPTWTSSMYLVPLVRCSSFWLLFSYPQIANPPRCKTIILRFNGNLWLHLL